MISKGVALAALIGAVASAPVSIPMAAGERVVLSAGPFEIHYQRDAVFDLGLIGDCLVNECPVFEIRVGEPQNEMYTIGF